MPSKRNTRTAGTRSAKARPQQPSSGKSRGARGGRQAPALQSHLEHAVCSISDPFCPAAFGSKWPDGNGQRTLPITVQQLITISTNAAGDAAVLFFPDPTTGWAAATVTALNTYSNGSNQLTNSAWLKGNCSGYRIVSAGLQFRPITSMMNSSGYYTLAELPSYNTGAITYGSTAFGNLNTGPSITSTLNNPKPTSYIYRSGGTESRQFNAFQGAAIPTDVDTTNDWPVVELQVHGAPVSASVLAVELVYHLEVQITPNAVPGLVTKASGNQPEVVAASNSVLALGSAFIAGGREVVEQSIKSRVMGLMRSAGKSVARGVISALPYGGTALQLAHAAHIPMLD